MGTTTAISWTHIPGYQGGTWNCWQGCTKVSPGCTNCYMFRDKKHYGQDPNKVIRSSAATFNLPTNTIPRTAFFTCSWSDFLHPDADLWRAEACQIMEKSPRHLFLILTKRPERIDYFPARWLQDWPENVWMGATVENQAMAKKRIPDILRYPAPVIFLSLEPMLEAIRLTDFPAFWENKIHWILCGFESGPKARIPREASFLADDIRIQCREAVVPFFFKQIGGNHRIGGVWGGDKLNGVQYHEFPEAIK